MKRDSGAPPETPSRSEEKSPGKLAGIDRQHLEDDRHAVDDRHALAADGFGGLESFELLAHHDFAARNRR